MNRCRKFLIIIIAMGTLPGIALSQQAGISNATVSIVDGTVTLEGDFRQIAGIEVKSAGEHLELLTETLPNVGTIPLTAPFTEKGYAITNKPSNVVMGVLGSRNRINFYGATKTSVQYSAPSAIAEAGDLSVHIAAGDCSTPISLDMSTPASWTCVRGNWESGFENIAPDVGFQLIDNEIYLEGDFENLSGIEVISANGNLALAEVANFVPFPGQATSISAGNSVVLGALGETHRADLNGRTLTAIQYEESLDFALDDLTIHIGLGDGGPERIPVGSVDEKSGRGATIQNGHLALIGPFPALTGIEAVSNSGLVFIEEDSNYGTKLFPGLTSDIVSNSENQISVRTTNRVDYDGLTATGIYFFGDADAVALADLQVIVNLGAEPPISLPNESRIVPEPSSASLFMLALLSSVYLTRKRRRHVAFRSADEA